MRLSDLPEMIFLITISILFLITFGIEKISRIETKIIKILYAIKVYLFAALFLLCYLVCVFKEPGKPPAFYVRGNKPLEEI